MINVVSHSRGHYWAVDGNLSEDNAPVVGNMILYIGGVKSPVISLWEDWITGAIDILIPTLPYYSPIWGGGGQGA